MNERKEKIKIVKLIVLFFVILSFFLINFGIIFSNHIDVSFDPYIPPNEPSTPSPSPSNPDINEKPIANITMSEIGYINETVIIHGNKSYDPDGTITGYRWDYNNDGLFDTDWTKNPFTTYIFNKTGNHTVKLQVKDKDGAKDTDIKTINIIKIEPEKVRPIAENNGPYFSEICENITFNSNGSYDSDGNITSWHWDFGDGNSSNQSNPVHSYKKTGSYIVILTVEDNDGLINQDYTTANINKKNITYKKSNESSDDYGKDKTILLLSLSSMFLAVIIATITALIILRKEKRNEKNKKSKSKKVKNKKKKESKKKQNKKSTKKTKNKKTKEKRGSKKIKKKTKNNKQKKKTKKK